MEQIINGIDAWLIGAIDAPPSSVSFEGVRKNMTEIIKRDRGLWDIGGYAAVYKEMERSNDPEFFGE